MIIRAVLREERRDVFSLCSMPEPNTAGLCALAGWINPLGAAVLMPVASLALLMSTLRGTPVLRRWEKAE